MKIFDVFKYDVSDVNAAYKAHCNERGVTDGVMSRYRRLFPILVAVLVGGVVASTSNLWLSPLSVDYSYTWIEVSAFIAFTAAATWLFTAICLGIFMVRRRLEILHRAGITVKQNSTPSIDDLVRARKEINRQYKSYCQRTGRKTYGLQRGMQLSYLLICCLGPLLAELFGISDQSISLLSRVIASCIVGVLVFWGLEVVFLHHRLKTLEDDRAGASADDTNSASEPQPRMIKRLKTLHTEVNDYLKMRPDFLFGTLFGLIAGMFGALFMVELSPLFENVHMAGRPISEQLLAMALTVVGIAVGVISGMILGWIVVLLLWKKSKTNPEAVRAKYPAFDPAEGQNGHIQ